MKSKENDMALNSLFFEKVLGEVGRVLERLDGEGGTERELSYQEGKAFMCYQIYRQNIHNPRLLEISTARIEKVKELRLKWDKEGDTSQATSTPKLKAVAPKKSVAKKTVVPKKKEVK